MKPKIPDYRFCPMCGADIHTKYHEGRDRHVCPRCGHVIYINPIPATTLVLLDTGRVLLTLRAQEPYKGMWCLPGGFVEWGETPEEGAKRELLEETGLHGEQLSMVGVYNSMANLHAILIGFIVTRWSGEITPGDDAAEVRWFDLDSRPQLAFRAHETLLADALESGEAR
ncbi:NUDIX hydrolase [bacterium]|nr:NUDIX hydrolase [bacterium]